MKSSVLTILISLVVATTVFSQRREIPKNYRKFDDKFLHFGFMLGANTSDFSLRTKSNILDSFNVYSVDNAKQPGFQLGIISSIKLGHPSLRLRFIPSLSFEERVLNYQFKDASAPNGIREEADRIGSTIINLPLLFKYRTARYNNFASYIVAGAQYSIDLQTRANSSQSYANPFIKLNQFDFQGQIGAGVDFFLTYFKFGLELKMSHGFSNVLIQDDTYLSKPLDQLRNKVWWFSITFEG